VKVVFQGGGGVGGVGQTLSWVSRGNILFGGRFVGVQREKIFGGLWERCLRGKNSYSFHLRGGHFQLEQEGILLCRKGGQWKGSDTIMARREKGCILSI